MTEGTTIVKNYAGIWSMPAMHIAKKAQSFRAKIQIKSKGKSVDAKSILMIQSMGLVKGTEVTIIAEGSDERQAVKELIALIDSRFGEDERSSQSYDSPKISFGDAICVDKGGHRHYGICVDSEHVIHFNDCSDEPLSYGYIEKVPMQKFLGGSYSFRIVDFRDETFDPLGGVGGSMGPLIQALARVVVKPARIKYYSPDETVRRAQNRLGEQGYESFSDCKQFAAWCKFRRIESD